MSHISIAWSHGPISTVFIRCGSVLSMAEFGCQRHQRLHGKRAARRAESEGDKARAEIKVATRGNHHKISHIFTNKGWISTISTIDQVLLE